jgi:hypothetical protein
VRIDTLGSYASEALRTESNLWPAIVGRLGVTVRSDGDVHNVPLLRLLHASLGLASEAGELIDAVRLRGPLDRTNLIEEVGDLLWYAALADAAAGGGMGAGLWFQSGPPVEADEAMLYVHLMEGHARLSGDIGVLADQAKRALFYGQPWSTTVVREVVRRIVLQLAWMAGYLGSTLATVAAANVAKLRQRYPERFSESQAQRRDLPAERAALEGGVQP